MKFKDLVKQGFSGMMAFGGFAAMTIMATEGFDPFAGFVLGGVAPFVGGSLALRHFRKQLLLDKQQVIEQRILELFTVYQEQMTIAQMAMALKLPIEKVEEEMNRLQNKGVVEINLTENGVVVYKLPQLKSYEKDYLLD